MLPAGATAPKKCKVTGIGEEPVVTQNALLDGGQRVGFDLEDGMAMLTDEVVMRSVADEFEIADPGAKVALRHQPDGHEQIQRAVYSGEIDRRIARRRPPQNLISGNVAAVRRERLQHDQPLWCDTNPVAPQPLDV